MAEPGKVLPRYIAGDGACPPEDSGGPRGYLAGMDDVSSWGTLKDLHTTADILSIRRSAPPRSANAPP